MISDKLDVKGILVQFLEILFVRLFTTSSARFSEFDSQNVILFQIKVFGRNIKDYASEIFHKSNWLPSFTRLSVITIEFIKYENRKYLTKIQLHLLLI